MKIVLGQMADMTKEREIIIRETIKEVNKQGIAGDREVSLGEAKIDIFSWAISIGFYHNLDTLKKRSVKSTLTLIQALCRRLGPGKYYFRGFDDEYRGFFELGEISIRDYFVYGIPIEVHINKDLSTVFSLPMGWINRFISCKFSGLIKPDNSKYLFKQANLKDLFYYLCSFMTADGDWHFQVLQDDSSGESVDPARYTMTGYVGAAMN